MDTDTFTFELTERSEVEAAWFVGAPGFDWMALIYRDSPTAPWRARYRHRYHASPEPFDPNDRISVHDMTPKDPSDPQAKARLVQAMSLAAVFVSEQYGNAKIYHVVVQGNAEKFNDLWLQQPFVHVKTIPLATGAIN